MLIHLFKSNMENDGKLKAVVDQWEESVLNDPEEYMQFYLFTFNYAKTTGQKSMDVEVIHILRVSAYTVGITCFC